MTSPQSDFAGTLTHLLGRVDGGDAQAESQICELVYGELRRIAGLLHGRYKSESLATTEIVNEFFIHILSDDRLGQMKNRRYFYGAAAQQMRRIIIDHWRRTNNQAHGGHLNRVDFNPELNILVDTTLARCGDLDALEHALKQLDRDRPRQFQIVQLKFFAGLNNEQIAEALDVSVETVKRDWKLARARLGVLLKEEA